VTTESARDRIPRSARPSSIPLPRAVRLSSKPRPPRGSGIPEWHTMSTDDRDVAWLRLIDWVVWLHDRYELSIEERIPPCWPDHPGIVEELWALMIWRTEIYDRPNRGAGDMAHSWHRELRAFIEVTVPFYARTCRAGHRGAERLVATDRTLYEQWRTRTPTKNIPLATLMSGRPRASMRDDTWITAQAMQVAIDAGHAVELPTVKGCLRYEDAWWQRARDRWIRIDDHATVASIEEFIESTREVDRVIEERARMRRMLSGKKEN
jgi:hypothetical protein